MNNPAQIKRFILTGTPGSGKTSVIRELEKFGHAVIHEAATDIIAQEQAKCIEKPWEEPEFVDQITHMQQERQMDATGDLQFYDRSPFCTYARLYCLVKLIVASKTIFTRTKYSFSKIWVLLNILMPEKSVMKML